MRRINFNRVLRIALGSTLSYFVCELLGLKYSASAAVITLLSIQDTKRETVVDVIKRILSYFYAMLSAFVLFSLIGYNALAFLIFMVLLVTISYVFDWPGTLSSSTVVTTHFLIERTFEPAFLLNEIYLIVIGTAAALVLNIFFVNNIKKVQRDCEYIELELSDLLKKIACCIKKEYSFDSEWLAFLYKKIDDIHNGLLKDAYNIDLESNNYYIEYLTMRKEQCQAIERMSRFIKKCEILPLPMDKEVCDLIYRVSNNIHNKSTYKNDLIYTKDISIRFEKLNFPRDQKELKAYTCVSEIIQEMQYFLELNNKFVKQLTSGEIKTYWN